MAESEKENKETFTGLARRLGELAVDKKRAALETSAALAGVSLKVSRQFVEAVPAAADILSADDLREWGEFGRRLAMASVDLGVKFFAAGASGLQGIPESSRSDVFQICTRQLVLSSSIALETYGLIPEITAHVNDDKLMASILSLAVEIAQRSAKHSAEFLGYAPGVADALGRFVAEKSSVSDAVVALTTQFANRTGGMTADLWADLGASLAKLNASNAVMLLDRASEFLEFGGSVTLHFVTSGSDVLSVADGGFDDWCSLGRAIAGYGNAVLISFLRATPRSFSSFKASHVSDSDICRVLQLIAEIAGTDAESALAAFKSSSGALKKVSVDQFDEWVKTGIRDRENDSAKARRSYFALETRASTNGLQKTRLGLPLEKIQAVLRMYVEALTGKDVEIAPLTAMPQESRIGDGKTIYLPNSVAEFDDDEKDFRLYKVLAAHGAGQIEFGTFERDTVGLSAAFAELSMLYEAANDDIDMFSLGGYIDDVQKAEAALSEDEIRTEMRKKQKALPKDSDYRAVLNAFPEPRLARKIFGTMENARIDNLMRQTYRGLRKDLDLMQTFLRANRPYIFDLPIHQVPFELLFQITLCGGATDDARQFYGQVISEIETVVEHYVGGNSLASVADSIMATSRVYNLFQNINPEQTQEAESDQTEEKSDFAYDDKDAVEAVTEDQVKREQEKKTEDIRDLFNAWNSLDDEGEPDDLQGAEAWSQN
ncbi:MAG: hypothetical protein ABIV21_06555, partial [Pyrinomonadaceae bacterium]